MPGLGWSARAQHSGRVTPALVRCSSLRVAPPVLFAQAVIGHLRALKEASAPGWVRINTLPAVVQVGAWYYTLLVALHHGTAPWHRTLALHPGTTP